MCDRTLIHMIFKLLFSWRRLTFRHRPIQIQYSGQGICKACEDVQPLWMSHLCNDANNLAEVTTEETIVNLYQASGSSKKRSCQTWKRPANQCSWNVMGFEFHKSSRTQLWLAAEQIKNVKGASLSMLAHAVLLPKPRGFVTRLTIQSDAHQSVWLVGHTTQHVQHGGIKFRSWDLKAQNGFVMMLCKSWRLRWLSKSDLADAVARYKHANLENLVKTSWKSGPCELAAAVCHDCITIHTVQCVLRACTVELLWLLTWLKLPSGQIRACEHPNTPGQVQHVYLPNQPEWSKFQSLRLRVGCGRW